MSRSISPSLYSGCYKYIPYIVSLIILFTIDFETTYLFSYVISFSDGTIEISGQQLSVIYDPPHLLKGLRNNLLTKNMIFKVNIAS